MINPALKEGLQIKLEMDIEPPANATTEVRTQLLPTPYQVRLYDLPSLFAGKLHAVLCRGWKSRVKGRDFYDFVWYVGRGIQPNLEHLEVRMRQSGHWEGGRSRDRFWRICSANGLRWSISSRLPMRSGCSCPIRGNSNCGRVSSSTGWLRD